MSIRKRLGDDLKKAMRAKDKARLRTIRSLRAALMDKEISERQRGKATLTEEQERAVIKKQAKQRRDSLQQYEKAGREDLAIIEREELAILADFLPRQLDEATLRTHVRRIIEQTGATSIRDLGRVMGTAMKELGDEADGRVVQTLARALLNETA